MKKLSALLEGVNVIKSAGKMDILISSVCYDASDAISSSLFFAIKGHSFDGHHCIRKAISAGSIGIICEEFPSEIANNVTYVKVQCSRYAIGIMSANYFDHPSIGLQLVAVTGTNGKTSTVDFLHQLFRKQGINVGLLSTVCYKVNDQCFPAHLTTPHVVTLNQFLAKMVEENCRYCFMEASSEGLMEGRLVGVKLAGAVFTNLSLDHLNYHKTYDAYKEAKKSLFDTLLQTSFAIANYDDKEAGEMLKDTKALKYFFSLKSPSDFTGKIIKSSFSGLELLIDGAEMGFGVSGDFNAYNLLAAYAVACCLKESDREKHSTALQSVSFVKGRFQIVDANRFKVIIDYAHTPVAMKEILTSINCMKNDVSNVISVVGCGGNRDREKRPLMARISAELSDKVIVTSDNPRYESPEAIINDMMEGLNNTQRERAHRITDRRLAIKLALNMAKAQDIVLIAGRGHETHQLIKNRKEVFDDFEVVREILREIK